MVEAAPLPPFAAIVVAAGSGSRAALGMPKQLAPWRGRPLVAHSVAALLEAGAAPVVIAVPEGMGPQILEACGNAEGLIAVDGGATRQQSVAHALGVMESFAPARVLIHDAARPDLPRAVIARLLAALETSDGAVPVLPVVDSLAVDEGGMMTGSADRETLRRVQTPQAFAFPAIVGAFSAWRGASNAGDDAQVMLAAGGRVAHVAGDERLAKMTFAEDFVSPLPAMRIGSGYDVHRLAAGEELWLSGLRIAHDRGLSGHSDADVALHAITDALLGAIGAGDIGSHFPPSDARWKGASSDRFLVHARDLAAEAGYRIGNVDLTLICEAPKIGPHRAAMQARIAELLGVPADCISVKATTTERLGFTGREEGIAAQAVALLVRN